MVARSWRAEHRPMNCKGQLKHALVVLRPVIYAIRNTRVGCFNYAKSLMMQMFQNPSWPRWRKVLDMRILTARKREMTYDDAEEGCKAHQHSAVIKDGARTGNLEQKACDYRREDERQAEGRLN